MSDREKRVVIMADTQTHMMPALAKEMARRNHDLVLGDAADGLADECAKLGARVEVVPDTADQTKPDTFQKLVDRAKDVFGGFDSACIRTGVHVAGDILQAKLEDAQMSVDGNFLAAFYALKAVLPPLVEQKSGQVVVNTSASGLRPQHWATLYSAQRAATNALMRCAGQTVAPHGVTVCGTGTYAMNYPGYYEIAGVDPTPEVKKELGDKLPIKRLIEPQDAANVVAPLLDGSVTVLTSQFFSIDGGWAFE